MPRLPPATAAQRQPNGAIGGLSWCPLVERAPHRAARFLPLLRARVPAEAILPEVLSFTDAAAGRAFEAARGGSPPALSRRKVQYSQVRLVTLGSALRPPASLISPGVKLATLPSSRASS